jgi:hypothetical protein
MTSTRQNGRSLLTHEACWLSRQWLQFDAPVGEVEELLLTKYHVFEHTETGARNIACSQ